MSNRPEVKTGINRGKRVHWFWCPKCGASPEHPTKAGANRDKRLHVCKDG